MKRRARDSSEAGQRWSPPPGRAIEKARSRLDLALLRGRFFATFGIVQLLFTLGLLGMPAIGIADPSRFVGLTILLSFLIAGFAAVLEAVNTWYRGRPVDRARLFEACPSCGQPPSADRPDCCRRRPRGWTPADHLAFWHELESADPAERRPRRDLLPTSPNSIWMTVGDRRRFAWRRPRGSLGASAAFPEGGRSERAGLARVTISSTLARAFFAILILSLLRTVWPPTEAIHAVAFSIDLGMAVFLAMGIVPRWRLLRSVTTPAAPRCAGCGYTLGEPIGDMCPECGSALEAWNAVSFVPTWTGDGLRRSSGEIENDDGDPDPP